MLNGLLLPTRYWADVMYGQSATYFYAAGIGLFTLFNIWYRVRHKCVPHSTHAGGQR